MSTEIITGFQLNNSSPIDTRIIASGSVARNSIPYKYEGLRVFDTSDHIAYVWINNSWVSENFNGIMGTENGNSGYFPKFNNNYSVDNSIICQNLLCIGIGTIPSSNFYKLDVNGKIKCTYIYGNGSNISNINGSNISSGTIGISYMPKGSSGTVMCGLGNSTSPGYVSLSQLSVGTSSVSNKVKLYSAGSINSYYLALSTTYNGNSEILSSSSLRYEMVGTENGLHVDNMGIYTEYLSLRDSNGVKYIISVLTDGTLSIEPL